MRVPPTDTEAVTKLALAASQAAPLWAAVPPRKRASALEEVAATLDHAADELIDIAIAETNLPEGRLRGELTRTTFQLRLFGEVLREGSFVGVTIDHSDPAWPMGAARPDLRRMNVALGATVVFAASNFPFAFSVAGGDTASALAAGCPVIVKANPGHEGLSLRTAELVAEGLAKAGSPEGIFGIAFGFDAGLELVDDPRIMAGAFTGSLGAGRALFDRAAKRPVPIPFYAEMGSTNPTFVTPRAAAERLDEITAGYVAAITGSDGQLCTKPGILFAPATSNLPARLSSLLEPPPIAMLNTRIAETYTKTLGELASAPGVTTAALAEGNSVSSAVLTVALDDVVAEPDRYLKEVFGPASLVIQYNSVPQLLESVALLEGQLTATVFGEPDEECAKNLVTSLSGIAGRVLWNQWPTGLSVTWAQTHGGPYPATTASATTSVGTTAIERFLRPVTFQNIPPELLPPELQESNPLGLPRRVDGVLHQALTV